jgi:hypothetical protein
MEYRVSLASKADLVPCASEDVYNFRHFISYLLSEVESYLWIAQQASGMKELHAWPEDTYVDSILRVKGNITP